MAQSLVPEGPNDVLHAVEKYGATPAAQQMLASEIGAAESAIASKIYITWRSVDDVQCCRVGPGSFCLRCEFALERHKKAVPPRPPRCPRGMLLKLARIVSGKVSLAPLRVGWFLSIAIFSCCNLRNNGVCADLWPLWSTGGGSYTYCPFRPEECGWFSLILNCPPLLCSYAWEIGLLLNVVRFTTTRLAQVLMNQLAF
jgi:hypothetical protein